MGYTPYQLSQKTVSGSGTIYGGLTTGKTFTLQANEANDYPCIVLTGNGTISLRTYDTLIVAKSTATYLTISYTTPDVGIEPLVNKNLFLNPTGTGRVKFGTYTAGAATDSTGYIDIIDAAGNVRKLMVQA